MPAVRDLTKTSATSIAGEWLCPITHKLMVEPVMAEDGNYYERAAVEKWLGEQQRSPSTNAAMGNRLVPSPQVCNTIEHLVRSGLVDDDKAAAWTKKLDDEKCVKEVRVKADQGDPHAMFDLGFLYFNGERGLAQDRVQARAWLKRAAELGHVKGMAMFGECLLGGLGGPSVPTLGLVYTARAAERGSEVANVLLGEAFMEGHYGLPQDSGQAKYHFRKIVEGGCEVKNCGEAARKSAKEFFRQLS